MNFLEKTVEKMKDKANRKRVQTLLTQTKKALDDGAAIVESRPPSIEDGQKIEEVIEISARLPSRDIRVVIYPGKGVK